MHWTGIVLGAGLAGLMLYVWLFVGSSRPDAESQMTILFCLICAFGSVTVIVGRQTWLITKRDVRWRGQTIKFAAQPMDEARNLNDVAAVKLTPWGAFALQFRDGTRIKLDANARGAQQLIDVVSSDLEARISS